MVVGEVDAAQLDRLGNAYGEAYRAHEAEMLRPMPQVVALLDRLAEAGVPLAVVTNRVQPSAEGAVAALGWTERFAVVVGSTVTPLPKPAADPALYALERLGIAPSEAAYVGDNEADALCAAAAGIPLVVLVGEASGHAALITAARRTPLRAWRQSRTCCWALADGVDITVNLFRASILRLFRYLIELIDFPSREPDTSLEPDQQAAPNAEDADGTHARRSRTDPA